MNSKVFVVFQVLMAFSPFLVQAGSISKGFTHFRGPRNNVVDEKTGDVSIQQSYYMISEDELRWDDLIPACRDFFGYSGTKLYMEKIAEYDMFNNLLSTTQNTTLFWTGGMYNVFGLSFQWHNGVRFVLPYASKWDVGHPESHSPTTRVLVYNEFQQENLLLRSAQSSEAHRYICELDLGDWTCTVDNDLVIILEATAGLEEANFQIGLDFVHDIADAWFANAGNRMSFIVFGDVSSTSFSLNNTMSLEEIHASIDNTFYLGSQNANTHHALNTAFEEFEASAGSKPKNVILVTASESSNPPLTLEMAENLLEANVEIFALGIGGNVNPTELLLITGNKTENVYAADEFSHLIRLLRPVKEQIC